MVHVTSRRAARGSWVCSRTSHQRPGLLGHKKHRLRETQDVIQDHQLDCINGTIKTDMKRGYAGENVLDGKNLRKCASKCTTRNWTDSGSKQLYRLGGHECGLPIRYYGVNINIWGMSFKEWARGQISTSKHRSRVYEGRWTEWQVHWTISVIHDFFHKKSRALKKRIKARDTLWGTECYVEIIWV